MIRTVPTINSTRLALRALRSEDFGRFAEIRAMPDRISSASSAPEDRRAAWESFLRNAGHWQMTGFGRWAVIDQRSRNMIGDAGFGFSSAPLGDDVEHYPMAEWTLLAQSQGSGLVHEAVRAAHEWFDRVIPGKLVLMLPAENQLGLQLGGQLGYRELRRDAGETGDIVLMRRDGPPGK